MRQIVRTANALQLNTGRITKACNAYEHDIMLLQIVSNTRNISGHLFPSWQSQQHTFSIGRIGFLRFFDEGPQNNTLGKWFAIQQFDIFTDFFERSGFVHIVQCGHVVGGLLKNAECWNRNRKKKMRKEMEIKEFACVNL